MSLFCLHCDDETCPEGYTCTIDGGAPLGGGSAGGAGGNGAEGGGGSTPVECEPIEGEPIGADCGVFVQAGESGNGSQASPFGSISDAAAGLGQASRVYACGDTSPRPEVFGSADYGRHGRRRHQRAASGLALGARRGPRS